MTHEQPFYEPYIVDQKDLNETLVMAIAEVARCNIHHCAELFSVPISLASRFALMAQNVSCSAGQSDQLLDLATTPCAVWRINLTCSDVQLMQQRTVAMMRPYLEPYRTIVAKLNEQVILTLLRYVAQPKIAALVSGLADPTLMSAMAGVSCSTLLQSAKNIGRPLVFLTINELFIDRIFSLENGITVHASTRGLLARVMRTPHEFASDCSTWEQCAIPLEPTKKTAKKGRPVAAVFPPDEVEMIEQLIAQGLNSRAILAFTQTDMTSTYLRRFRQHMQEQTQTKTQKTFCVDSAAGSSACMFEASRFQDTNLGFWSNGIRRLIGTSIVLHQQILMSIGLTAHAAFFAACEHYNSHYAHPHHHISLTRLISAVYMPMREGLIELAYCRQCSVAYLLHQSYQPVGECPVCSLVKFKKLNQFSTVRRTGPKKEKNPQHHSAQKINSTLMTVSPLCGVVPTALMGLPLSRPTLASVWR
jgi:hypothetical protein